MSMTDEQKDTSRAAIQFAIRRAGSARALSDEVGCSYRQVFRWRAGEQIIGPEYAAKVAEAVDLERKDLRPDLFG